MQDEVSSLPILCHSILLDILFSTSVCVCMCDYMYMCVHKHVVA